MNRSSQPLTIIVVGASGDLARRKIFPALFALYCQELLPEHFRIFGFARSDFTDGEFREKITENLTCRYAPGESCAARMEEFLARCHYQAGDYGSRDSFLDLYGRMRQLEAGRAANRFYYLAIPPAVFLDVARAIGDAGLVSCGVERPWSRVVVEKPFGRDRKSSDLLTSALAEVFTESQMFRIDHYLGKEVIQNLLVLRFANLIFEPIWNRDHIR
ncbi:MAG: glucose-6-phosphate dehydrogenase, partial [Planctomycetes bacterium]|nr:glucose-6-phosphate dehydrogenase [Planctomycetota bacterium]